MTPGEEVEEPQSPHILPPALVEQGPPFPQTQVSRFLGPKAFLPLGKGGRLRDRSCLGSKATCANLKRVWCLFSPFFFQRLISLSIFIEQTTSLEPVPIFLGCSSCGHAGTREGARELLAGPVALQSPQLKQHNPEMLS